MIDTKSMGPLSLEPKWCIDIFCWTNALVHRRVDRLRNFMASPWLHLIMYVCSLPCYRILSVAASVFLASKSLCCFIKVFSSVNGCTCQANDSGTRKMTLDVVCLCVSHIASLNGTPSSV